MPGPEVVLGLKGELGVAPTLRLMGGGSGQAGPGWGEEEGPLGRKKKGGVPGKVEMVVIV